MNEEAHLAVPVLLRTLGGLAVAVAVAGGCTDRRAPGGTRAETARPGGGQMATLTPRLDFDLPRVRLSGGGLEAAVAAAGYECRSDQGASSGDSFSTTPDKTIGVSKGEHLAIEGDTGVVIEQVTWFKGARSEVLRREALTPGSNVSMVADVPAGAYRLMVFAKSRACGATFWFGIDVR